MEVPSLVFFCGCFPLQELRFSKLINDVVIEFDVMSGGGFICSLASKRQAVRASNIDHAQNEDPPTEPPPSPPHGQSYEGFISVLEKLEAHTVGLHIALQRVISVVALGRLWMAVPR